MNKPTEAEKTCQLLELQYRLALSYSDINQLTSGKKVPAERIARLILNLHLGDPKVGKSDYKRQTAVAACKEILPYESRHRLATFGRAASLFLKNNFDLDPTRSSSDLYPQVIARVVSDVMGK